MAGNGKPPSLFRRLKSALVKYPLDSQQKFLPLNILDELINEENIKAELKISRTFSFINYHNHKQEPLVETIVLRAKKVFAILCFIGEVPAIEALLDEELSDDDLPLYVKDGDDNENILRTKDGEKTFESFTEWRAEQRVGDFLEKQWMFLAPVLDATGNHIILDARCPLPFVSMESKSHAHAGSIVYESELHPAHQDGIDALGSVIQLAAKEFKRETDFNQEKKNLDMIQKLAHDHLIRHYVTCQRGIIYYAIFPWADGGTLRDLWTHEDPYPRSKKLVLWSLQQMCGLTDALAALHTKNCRHGDLKPDNILHFKEGGQGKLVLADVGVSRIHINSTFMRNANTTTGATTQRYEAPEASEASKSLEKDQARARSRLYDMWSLGCVFLEFAIWLLYDLKAINEFHLARKGYHSAEEFYIVTGEGPSYRHDIHPIVHHVILQLREACRDTAMEALIDIITTNLLRIDVEERGTANDVVENFQKIVEAVRADKIPLTHDANSGSKKLEFKAGF